MSFSRTGPLSLRALATLLVALIGLGACGSNPYPGEPDNTLHVFLGTAIKSIDPAQAQDQYSNICVLNIYDQLYEYEYLERPFKLKPCLAAALPEVSEDRLTYTIKMKKGVHFIDDPCFPAADGREAGEGREVTAHDFVFCLKRLMDRHTKSTGTWIFDGKIVGLDEFRKASADVAIDHYRGSYSSEVQDPAVEGLMALEYPAVEGLKALDDYTVRIQLKESYPQLIWTLAMGYTSIYPHEAIEYYGKQFLDNPVGTGPYLVEHVNRSKKLVLVRNPNYREDRFPETGSEEDRAKRRLVDAGKRLPLNDRVVMTVFKQTQPQWLYFMRGYLDRTGIPNDNFDGAVNKETFELMPVMSERGITLDKDPNMDIVYDCFNMEDEVVGKPAGAKGLAIRRAISLATDNEWTIRNLYNGRAARVDGPILKEFAEYDPAYRNPWKRRPGESRASVLIRARQVLTDAGYPGGKGVPTLIKDVMDSDISRTFFLAFQRDMADIGLKFEAHTTSFPELMRRLNNKKSQIWGVAWGADYPDPQNFFQLYYGPNKAPGVNKSCFDDPEFNELYAKARVLLAGEERTRLYRRMQEIVGEQCVWSFRCRRVNFNLNQPWLNGYRYNDMGQKYFKFCSVDAAKRREGVTLLNKATYWPVFVFFGLGAVLIIFTLVAARRRTTGW